MNLKEEVLKAIKDRNENGLTNAEKQSIFNQLTNHSEWHTSHSFGGYSTYILGRFSEKEEDYLRANGFVVVFNETTYRTIISVFE